MKDTYTPLEIDGKIVVVNAPEKPRGIADGITAYLRIENYEQQLASCTKYPTLEDDREYWQGKLGQQVEEGKDFKTYGKCPIEGTTTALPINYAIPPQQKQDDGDLWDEVEESIERDFGIPIKNLTGEAVIFYLKQHYSLKRK